MKSLIKNSTNFFPLSFEQEQFLSKEEVKCVNEFNNISAMTRLIGQVQIPEMLAALNEIVRRHEIFRTTFNISDQFLVQTIAAQFEIELPVVDFMEFSLDERDVQVQQYIKNEVHSQFNLSSGPLFRVFLLKLASEEYILLFIVHHIIFDISSFEVLNKELSTLYTAYVQNIPSPLSELSIQYADYAQWQHQHLNEMELKRQSAYWSKNLEGCSALLNLPLDRQRPAIQCFNGASYRFDIHETIVTSLKETCKQCDGTLLMLLQN